MPDRVGQQIGNYRLVKLLGSGGFADVYLGQHMRLASKQAAVKILHLMDVDAQKFQEEAETTEKLVHPHIVRLLDFDIEQGTPFLVLDYAPGGSLRGRHPRGSIVSLAQVGAYLKEIAPALQYAHNKHILHRDIKPDNILIGRDGELLLSDFGIAVLTQTGRTSFSAAYGVGGTPYYMAPETYQGKPVKESDQYALAVVVYEWLCGSVPFKQGNFIQLGFQHAHEPVPSLRGRNPAIPAAVETVVLKALSKEPKDRFKSVKAFVQEFEQACMPTQRSSVQPPQPGQDETEVRVTSRSVPPMRRTEQPALQTTIYPPIPVGVPVTTRRVTRRKVLVGLAAGLAIVGGGIAWWELSRTWHAQTSGTSQSLHGIAWLGSQFVAVGTDGTILTSPDGKTWTVQNSGTSQSLSGVAWSGSQFVAVGDNSNGQGNSAILTSPDGRTWTARNSGISQVLGGVAWSGSQFVAVGETILTSPDGKTWTAWNSGTSGYLGGVAWSGSQFVAVGSSVSTSNSFISTPTILTSPDGKTWTVQNSGTSGYLGGVAWSGSQFVAVGTDSTILTSPDGSTWTSRNSSYSGYLSGIAWSGSQFVAVGSSDSTILTSPDGKTWTVQNSGTSQGLHGIAWSGSQFVAVGEQGTILTSP